MADIQPEEFALRSGRIGGARALAMDGVEPIVIQWEEMRSSDGFTVYVRANMEGSRWVSTSLVQGSAIKGVEK